MAQLGNLRLGQWQVRKQSLHFGVFQVGRSVVDAGLSLMLVVLLSLGLEGRLWRQTIALVLFGIAGFWLFFPGGLPAFSWRRGYIRGALEFGVPLIPHICGISMLTVLDRMVVMHFLGPSQTGVYMVAIQIALGMALVADAVNKAYVPWLFEHLSDSNVRTTRQMIVRMTYAYFGAVLLLALAMALLAPWFVGPEYREVGLILRWLAFGQAFNSMYLTPTNYIFNSRKMATLYLSIVSVGIFHIILAIILVQKYELTGVAVAYAVSMATRFILTWYLA